MGIEQKLDIPYGSHSQLLDLYFDNTHTAKAGIIDVHGGGWFRGNKSKDADWAQRLVRQGYLVIVPEYRITPVNHYPAPLVDMDEAYWYLLNGQLDFDHHHIGAVGSSAGGNMVTELAIKYGIPAVSLSGILDIEDWLNQHQAVVAKEDTQQNFNQVASATINQTGHDDPFYKWFIMNYFDQQVDQLHAATPYHRVTDKTGPMFLGNSLDEFVPTSGVLQMSQALVDHQIPHVTTFLPGSRHAKGYLDDVFAATLQFMNQYL